MDKIKISDKFDQSNKALEDLRVSIENSKSKADQDAIELLAIMELNIDLIKEKLSGTNNYKKRERALSWFSGNTAYNARELGKDPRISNYLNKHGIFDESTFTVIDSVLHFIVAILIFSVALMFKLSLFTAFIAFIAVYVTTMVFFPLFERVDFYRTTKK